MSALSRISSQTNTPLPAPERWQVRDRQLTSAPHGHLLTNIGCWSHDGSSIYYDVRSDPAGSIFDSDRIERVDVATQAIEVCYRSQHQACCGVVTSSPLDDRIAFILGPEHPTADWQYSASHRQGLLVRTRGARTVERIDARCVTEPLIAGALRGGSHVHTFDPQGRLIAFTYEDALLPNTGTLPNIQINQRNIGISIPDQRVAVRADHPRNHSGAYFSVLVSRTWDQPVPGSDEINRAYEDAWIGTHGYLRRDGTRQARAIAFLGDVISETNERITELFVLDLPHDLTRPSSLGPLCGTMTTRPAPPEGVIQRRLTHTQSALFPGIQGPRHWPRSHPSGQQIACLMRDPAGQPQICLVDVLTGNPRQLTQLSAGIASAFSFSPDGKWIAHIADGSVCVTATESGETYRLTAQFPNSQAPRPEACVFSPSGQEIAYVRAVRSGDKDWNQIFVVSAQLT